MLLLTSRKISAKLSEPGNGHSKITSHKFLRFYDFMHIFFGEEKCAAQASGEVACLLPSVWFLSQGS